MFLFVFGIAIHPYISLHLAPFCPQQMFEKLESLEVLKGQRFQMKAFTRSAGPKNKWRNTLEGRV